VTFRAELENEPWRFDFFTVLRRLERSFPEKPRIGDAASRREEFVALGQDPFLDFPASNLAKVDRDAQGRIRIFAKFLGLTGPQGALPIATTDEAYGWLLARDDAFPRFLDIVNHRFLQLFFRAWADSRPVAHHDRPSQDRFRDYLGSMVGIGTAPYRDLDSVPDPGKLAYAGLLGPQTKSASRLRDFIAGIFGVEAEIDEFVGSYLAFDENERTLLGQRGSALGVDMMIGGSVFSVQDKIRLRIYVKDLRQYESFLPSGARSTQLADAVYFYIGDQLDWDVELALPAGKVEPMKLGTAGRLGWTSWMAPNWTKTDETVRADARFNLAERRQARPARAA
jgi:type VI secretion system protein ImpH